MAAHHEFGRLGEQMAAEWLMQRGYQVISRNWKHARYELDIIAAHHNVLHFIEVKSRRDDQFGKPEDWVDRKKAAHILSAGEAYQFQHPQWHLIQYDILSILLIPEAQPEFFFIEDVYWW